jgi:hypothetical protein
MLARCRTRTAAYTLSVSFKSRRIRISIPPATRRSGRCEIDQQTPWRAGTRQMGLPRSREWRMRRGTLAYAKILIQRIGSKSKNERRRAMRGENGLESREEGAGRRGLSCAPETAGGAFFHASPSKTINGRCKREKGRYRDRDGVRRGRRAREAASSLFLAPRGGPMFI